jgi:hypothetical protein
MPSYVENSQGVHADQALKNVLIPLSNTYYRLSLFLWNPTSDGGAGSLVFTIQWTPPFGATTTLSVTVDLASASSSHTIDAGIWVLAGTPVQYSALGGGTYGTATYSYLLAIEDNSRQEGGGCGGPLVPMPIPVYKKPCPCQRCQNYPCSCGGGGGGYGQGPPVIIINGQQPLPRQLPFRQMPFEPEYGGPWQDCGDCE